MNSFYFISFLSSSPTSVHQLLRGFLQVLVFVLQIFLHRLTNRLCRVHLSKTVAVETVLSTWRVAWVGHRSHCQLGGSRSTIARRWRRSSPPLFLPMVISNSTSLSWIHQAMVWRRTRWKCLGKIQIRANLLIGFSTLVFMPHDWHCLALSVSPFRILDTIFHQLQGISHVPSRMFSSHHCSFLLRF